MRRWIGSRSFFLALAPVAVLAAGTAASRSERPTVVHHYEAFEAGRLAPGLKVRASVPGDCWTTSAIEGRPYTWRCGTRNRYVHDPCFSATARSRIVVCPDAPWSRRVLLLRLTQHLPPWRIYKGGRWRMWPWGIETTDGKRCITLSASATGQVAGMQPTFSCKRDGLLLGFPNRKLSTWAIHHASGWRSKRATLVAISAAWW